MELSVSIKQAYTEVDEFLNLLDDRTRREIPEELREFFKKNKDKKYFKYIDLEKPIKEQNLKKETLAIIAFLNLKYWCKDPNEKMKLKSIYEENEKKFGNNEKKDGTNKVKKIINKIEKNEETEQVKENNNIKKGTKTEKNKLSKKDKKAKKDKKRKEKKEKKEKINKKDKQQQELVKYENSPLKRLLNSIKRIFRKK